jgi:hypothetical protein
MPIRISTNRAINLFCWLSLAACANDSEPKARESGYVQGTVNDTQGKPLAGVDITIDNTLVYNSNLKTTTDSKGEYQIKLPGNFTWMAYAQIQKSYHGKTYLLDLHPENSEGFTSEGALRNFKWMLSGKKPGNASTGYYGGLITFDAFPGIWDVDDKAIVFTLTPVGNLIDGTSGQVLQLTSEDGYRLVSIPIGRYTLTASYKGSSLKLRNWNTSEAFVSSLQVDFQPHIPQQCDNCVKIEYNK